VEGSDGGEDRRRIRRDLPEHQREIVEALRRIVRAAAPPAIESIKWAQPVYEIAGPCAHVKAFKCAVNCGFWRGADLDDPSGLVVGTGGRMRHQQVLALPDIDVRHLGGLLSRRFS